MTIQSDRVRRLLQTFQSGDFTNIGHFGLRKQLKKDMKAISNEELSHTLELFFADLSQKIC
jgi:hypothetical protein